jgi:hypothetical protein
MCNAEIFIQGKIVDPTDYTQFQIIVQYLRYDHTNVHYKELKKLTRRVRLMS